MINNPPKILIIKIMKIKKKIIKMKKIKKIKKKKEKKKKIKTTTKNQIKKIMMKIKTYNKQIKFLDSNRRITNTDIKNSSTLILEEKECNIFNGEKIKINALGMIGGKGVGDGVAIFGSNSNKLEESSNMNTGELY